MNRPHWFRAAECRAREDRAPAKFTTIRHLASKLLRNAAKKGSTRRKRKAAALDGGFLASPVEK